MLPRATHRDRVVRPRRYGPEVGASIAGNDRSRGRVDRSAAHGGPLPGPYLRARPHGRRATLLAAALGVSLFWSGSRDRTHSAMMSAGAGSARSVSRLAPAMCRSGGIGRRGRLKICWGVTPVPVRVRPSAPNFVRKTAHYDEMTKALSI